MSDPFQNHNSELDSPAHDYYAVTPSDATDETVFFRALYIGSAGNVAAVPIDDGTAVTFVGVPAGTVLPIRGRRVNSTNTTASNIVGLV